MRAESPRRRQRKRSANSHRTRDRRADWRNATHRREGVSVSEAEPAPTKQCARHECVRIKWHVSLGVSHCWCYSRNSVQRTPNDLKLSDRRLGRDACAAGGKAAAEAGGVTETPVRSSAWLGVAASRARAARGRPDGDTARGWRVSVDGNKLGSAGIGMASEKTGSKSSLNRTRVATPNDPKLSDGRGWRDRCVVVARRRRKQRA